MQGILVRRYKPRKLSNANKINKNICVCEVIVKTLQNNAMSQCLD